MKLTTILFDLDGTLLPMDQDVFIKSYFSLLAAKAAPRGYDPKALVDSIWRGTGAMIKNDGSCTNEAAFWRTFSHIFGEDALQDKPLFDEFYQKEFQQVQSVCGFNEDAAKTVRTLQAAGYRLVLATNPIFPAVATQSRIRWAGLQPEDFVYYTTYENSRFCKPTLAYYQSILEAIGCCGEECLMVGNDVAEDMVAADLGMSTFLLTDCLINKPNADITQFAHGSFADLLQMIETMV